MQTVVETAPSVRQQADGTDESRKAMTRLLHDLRWALATPEGDAMPGEARHRWLQVVGSLETELHPVRRRRPFRGWPLNFDHAV